MKTMELQAKSERIAKMTACSGLCSRREAERWIEDRRFKVNGKILDSRALAVSETDAIARQARGSRFSTSGSTPNLPSCRRRAAPPAFRYILSDWAALTRYEGDGRLEIDNNRAGNTLRGVAIGRKSWLLLQGGFSKDTWPTFQPV